MRVNLLGIAYSITKGGHAHAVKDINHNKWSYQNIERHIFNFGHSNYMLAWYKNGEDKCKWMVNDKDAYEVYQYANEMKCVVNLYVDDFVKGIVWLNVEDKE